MSSAAGGKKKWSRVRLLCRDGTKTRRSKKTYDVTADGPHLTLRAGAATQNISADDVRPATAGYEVTQHASRSKRPVRAVVETLDARDPEVQRYVAELLVDPSFAKFVSDLAEAAAPFDAKKLAHHRRMKFAADRAASQAARGRDVSAAAAVAASYSSSSSSYHDRTTTATTNNSNSTELYEQPVG